MTKDTLFLLKAGFTDNAYPGKTFLCPHGIAVEGVLALYPELEQKIDVLRVDFPRPRSEVIAVAGESNQGLPLLVLSSGKHSTHHTGKTGDTELVAGKDNILAALTELYAVAELHP